MKTLSFLLFMILSTGVFAQQEDKPIRYWGNTDEFIKEQAEETFRLVNRILKDNPPATQESLMRQSALLHLDAIFHDTRLDDCEPFFNFVSYRIQQVLDELEKPVTRGMKIYKLYNHSFIARTKNATIAFDLYRGGRKGGNPYIPDEMMKKIADHCDIMFVTHQHSDHSDWIAAGFFTEAGKDVIVPAGLWTDKGKHVKQMKAEEVINENILLPSGAKLKVKIMPGHQDKLLNNIYIVTFPEGITVSHTGDQWKAEDKEWIAKIKEHSSIDVLLVHCWAMPLEEIVEGFNPKLVITGHENEMNHTIDHREPYWLNYRRMGKVTQPKVFMAWGESFHYLGR